MKKIISLLLGILTFFAIGQNAFAEEIYIEEAIEFINPLYEDIVVEKDIRAVKSHVIHPPELAHAPLNPRRQHGNDRGTKTVMGIVGRHCFTSIGGFGSILHENPPAFHPFFKKFSVQCRTEYGTMFRNKIIVYLSRRTKWKHGNYIMKILM